MIILNNTIEYFFILNIFLFLIGFIGMSITKKNIIILLMSIELMLLAINLNFIMFSLYLDDILGQIFSLILLTIAAAEAAIGLAILIGYYRITGIIYVNYINLLKG